MSIKRIIYADPDLEQAVEDFLDTAAELRDRSVKLAETPASRFDAEKAYVSELRERIGARAEKLGMSTYALLILLGIRLREREGRPLSSAKLDLFRDLGAAEEARDAARAALLRASAAFEAAEQRVAAIRTAQDILINGMAELASA